MKLKGKVALVTGGYRGIGKAIAILFAKEGASITLNYNKSESSANEVCQSIKKLGRECILARGDISNSEGAKSAINQAISTFGKVDILVNNAGIMLTNTFDYSALDSMIRTNLYSMVFMIEGLKDNFIRLGGRIINIASVAAIGTALPGNTFYSITKGGVVALTKRYAFELGKYNTTVNAIAPGFIDTDLNRAGKSEERWNETVKELSSKTVLGRIGKPEDIAKVALFLASSDSDFITGQVIVADGGRIDYLTHSM
ncbi:MAG: SDR family oxidoreductase [Candidatus Micrarchaeaceae archaeon]